MMRLILLLLGIVVMITVLRSVIGILMKGLSGWVSTSTAPANTARPAPPAAPGGELKRDPVCGTFISAATAVTKKSGGQTHYFCSAECRDRFAG
ncbi:MAG: hypothetical protein K2X35_08460 [Bryobacteraceae bacterium]|nr:hypothetical protein [Bryobacteraceae bacterium]